MNTRYSSQFRRLKIVLKIFVFCMKNKTMKKRSERRKRWVLAVVGGAKNFRPAADLLPGGAGRPKFNQLEMVTTFT